MNENTDIKQVIHELAIVVSNIDNKSDEDRLRRAIDILENHVEETTTEIEYVQPEV